MFDGIEQVVLPTAELDHQLELFCDGLGFHVENEEVLADGVWADVWGLPGSPTRSVLLGKTGSQGGWVRLVLVPGLPAARPAGPPDRAGCYALDFYLRDPDGAECRLSGLGWGFRSDPVRYPLPGTGIEVRERMLENATAGLLHALVRYRPHGTRCVLDLDERASTSEVVAMVFATGELRAAKEFAVDVLGATCYFDDRFEGPAVEELLDLRAGEGFRATLFRGPRSRNARLEFIEAITDEPPRDVVPRAIATIEVADLELVLDRLGDGRHGSTTPVVAPSLDGVVRPRVGVATRYGAHLDLVQASPDARR